MVMTLDLGSHPPSDAFLTAEQLLEPETHYPLQLFYCKDCGLVQIGYSVLPEILFGPDYPYETRVNGVKHFQELAKTVYDRFKPKNVLDIGSNDGTLLEQFQVFGSKVIGIEPVEHLAFNAKVETVCDFWGKNSEVNPKPDVITACNVFAHVPDIHGFVEGVANNLAKNGVFVIENPYLYDTLNGFEFDQIYHEHLCYLSQRPLQHLLAMHDMVIFDMQRRSIHGGTMRYYVGRRGEWLQTTIPHENFTEELLADFAEGVKSIKRKLLDLLWRLKLEGNAIVGISAPAKGNTLLNYCGIGTELLDCISEKSKLKIGKFTPGKHIPVVSDEEMLEDSPNYGLLLAWNWKDQIKKNLKGFRGKWIIPVPEPRIEEK